MWADTLFENATFVTMQGPGHTVEAVASHAGAIVYAGDRAGAAEFVGATTRRVDLGGATVFPAFADPHTHLVASAIGRYREIDFDADPVCRSIADVQAKVRARAAELPAGRWILGFAVRDERYAEHRYPTRQDLDAVAPDHPVLIRGTGSHVVCANSLALRIAGIDRTTPDPPGGSIDRDADGEPNGILRERGKLGLTQGRSEGAVIPPYTIDENVDALSKAAVGVVAASGVATINVMVTDADEIHSLQEARNRGGFPVRTKILVRVIESMITLTDLERLGIQNGFGDPWLSIGGVKMSVDGGSLQRNAAMYEPYPGQPDNRGLVRIQQDELDETTARAHRLGLRNVVHAIGDRAYDMALTALEKATGAGADHRSRIEHLGNLPTTDEQIARATAAGIVASPQPPFIWVYGDKWLDIFGEAAMKTAFPFRRMLDSGLKVIASSDFGMTPLNPLVGIQAAVTRRTEGGNVIGADQAVTPYEAVEMYTSTSAWSDFDEDVRGTIAVGKYADLTALGADPLTSPADDIAAIPITATVVGGQVVHGPGATP